MPHLMPNTHTLWIFAWILFFLGVAVGVWILCAYIAAQKEIGSTPRVPMSMCDVHGMYPTETSVSLDCPSVSSGQVELCPFCVLDRVKKKPVPNA